VSIDIVAWLYASQLCGAPPRPRSCGWLSPAAGQSQHVKSAGVNFQRFLWLADDMFAGTL